MAVVRVSSSGAEPVGATSLREHVYGLPEDDATLAEIAIAAREWVESRTRRSILANSQYRLSLDHWPHDRQIELPRSPLTSSTSVSVVYYPDGGAQTTLSSSLYTVDDQSEPPRIVLNRDQTWPDAVLRTVNAVQVTWRAGSTSVPDRARHLVKLLTGHWFANREAVLVGAVSKEVEMAADALVWSLKVPD